MQELSVIGLILHASLPVQLVMAGLVVLSLLSWGIIFNKLAVLRRARLATQDFEQQFWSGIDLNRLYEDTRQRQHAAGVEKLFQAGFAEFAKLRRQGGVDNSEQLDGARRAMRAAAQRELDALDHHNSFLATVGSVSPYIGLFGTVWGIMHAFIGLGNAGQATLATVAPGIAEALIATAIGLFAAIPAVVAYNRFAADVDRLAGRFDSFMEEFSNILQRLAAR
ncbi:protein TolQ [Vogesella fluminis]|uniref:Tol-Pal system protein TolQ n=1 Tax=Vogesella fluminis TaxID=1069161 RepID=A0ABQ3HBG8_9NEIS|nr:MULTISPECIES: protein TolQ [Vogesella]MDC7702324.1 protein TolQ [Vogesella indigofera]MDC7705370.1 protein TolQ [Vogesella indigofera]MDC7709157.1 protein TolQ [Vogesella indigofera]MDC7712105.1 protein TolQ [Vogesella indigofera]GHD80465.1 protein TolQ [Vogesella fluminis]